MKITGLDALSRTLQDLEKAVAGLDGDIAQVRFNPHDPLSIEEAIEGVKSAVDQKIKAHRDNEVVISIAEGIKERFRTAILEQAAAARLRGGNQE